MPLLYTTINQKQLKHLMGQYKRCVSFFEVVGHWQRGVRRFDPSKQNKYHK